MGFGVFRCLIIVVSVLIAAFVPDSLTHGEQSVLHVVPQEGHRDEREGGEESPAGENDPHKSIVARAERLGAKCVDARSHPIENASAPRQKRTQQTKLALTVRTGWGGQ